MTIANNKEVSFDDLQSSLEDLGFQYEKGNFTKIEMLNLVNKCCKAFLFNADQEEMINDGLYEMFSDFQAFIDDHHTIGVNLCTKDDLELVPYRKKQVKIIGQVKDILDGELSEEVKC
jgi:hypothetical protein